MANWSGFFKQSTTDTTYFIKCYKDGSWIRLIFYVDDLLCFGSSDAVEKEFEQSISSRFNINYNGQANWFLQMCGRARKSNRKKPEKWPTRCVKNSSHRGCKTFALLALCSRRPILSGSTVALLPIDAAPFRTSRWPFCTSRCQPFLWQKMSKNSDIFRDPGL